MRQEALCQDVRSADGCSSSHDIHDAESQVNSIFLKSDRIYEHNIVKINYTTYDLRRDQDVLNSNTQCRDIMMLAESQDETDSQQPHPFWYALILGVFHANVVYTGVGMRDYAPRRLEFLWVRWFQRVELPDLAGLGANCLDTVKFLPMARDDAFGFVDPNDALRGSQLIPAFRRGKVHSDAKGLSKCAGDAQDWRIYCVNRFVQHDSAMLTLIYWTSSFLDCDMLMRYLWGLAVGHIYTHESLSDATTSTNNAGGRCNESAHQHTHANDGSDCEVDAEEPDVIASGSKEMPARASDMDLDDRHSQIQAPEDAQTDNALELTLEDEDWYVNSEDDNLGGDGDVASDFEE